MSWTRPHFASLTGLAVIGAACAPDIGELEDTPSPDSVVVAQFDPTNPIPQLQLVPTPSALAQNPDGTIDQEAVQPAPCELPTEAQCLQFVDGGWPADLFPTLFFSAPLVMDTLERGIRLYEVTDAGPVEVPVTITQAPRPPPPEACQSGNNGTSPPMTFTMEDVTAAWGENAVDVTIAPRSGALKPSTQYIVVATRELRGAPAEGTDSPRPIEPSGLFYLLNDDEPPVTMDGQITNALLRSQVTGSVIASLFPGRTSEDLSAEELMQLETAVQNSGASLFGLYQFVDQSIGALLASGAIASRDEAVLVNTWQTGRAPTRVAFDPANLDFPSRVPFPLPNDQLLTTTSTETRTGVQVNFTGVDSPIVGALNTLDGFGLTTPITIPTTREVDPSTLEGNVVMVELDDMGMPTGTEPRIQVASTASTASTAPQIVIQPVTPLRPATRYAVGITAGVQDRAGQPVRPTSTFELLKSPTPLIEDGTVAPSVQPVLQCSTLSETGMLAPPEVVQQTATALEVGLSRPRWQAAFQALMARTPPVPRADLAMAFTYTTQSITDAVDAIEQLLPMYEALPPMQGRLLPTDVDVVDTGTTTNIASLIGVTEQFCLPACRAGALEPQIPRSQCAANRQEVENSPVCALFRGALAGRLGRARLLRMRTYDVTSGNPFESGTFTPETLRRPRVEYIPMWVITPRGSPPAGGWPVLVFQHGLGSEKETALLIANTFAAAGWATVAIDMPFHGQRASDIAGAGGAPCVDVDPDQVTCDLEDGTCMGGCDGAQDDSGTGFLSPNVFGVRDNFRQATVDQLALLRAVERESMGMGGLADLDGTRIGYVGQSLGGIAGGNLAAYLSPMDLEAAVLNTAGGNVTDILFNTVPSISAPLLQALSQLELGGRPVCEFVQAGDPTSGCQDTPAFRAFRLLAQWVIEPGDPLGTSTGVVEQLPMRPANFGSSRILMQVSQPDPVVPNGTSEQLARAYGFDLAGGAERYQVYDFSMLPQASMGGGCHGFLLAPTCGQCVEDTLCTTFGAQQQAAGFVASGGMSVGPRRPTMPLGGVIDCANPCAN